MAGVGSIYQSPSKGKQSGKPKGGLSRMEGPLEGSTNGIFGALMQASSTGAGSTSQITSDISTSLVQEMSQSGALHQFHQSEPGLATGN